MRGQDRRATAARRGARLAMAAMALLLAPPAAAQQGTGGAPPGPPPLAPGQPPDSGLPVILGQLRSTERALRDAARQFAGDPAQHRALALAAVGAGQGVLARVPPLAGPGIHVDAQIELEEARRALETPGTPAAEAARRLREAAEAVAAVAERIAAAAPAR